MTLRTDYSARCSKVTSHRSSGRKADCADIHRSSRSTPLTPSFPCPSFHLTPFFRVSPISIYFRALCLFDISPLRVLLYSSLAVVTGNGQY